MTALGKAALRPSWTANVETASLWALLALTLSLSCVLGVLTPYLLGVLAIAATLWAAGTRQLGAAYAEFVPRAFLAAFLVLLVCFAITAREPADVRFAGNFILFALAGGLYLLARKGADQTASLRVGQLALLGVVLALVVSLVSTQLMGTGRAASVVVRPIRLANTATILGFLCVMPVLSGGLRRNWLFLIGPALAIAVALLSGSRGPLLALPPLVLLATVFVARASGARALVTALAAMAVLAVAGAAVVVAGGRGTTLLTIAGQMLGGDAVSDRSANYRFLLYDSGLKAFAEAPIFGHGWAQLMRAILPHMAVVPDNIGNHHHLHNDVINMAVAAGVVGIATYLGLIAMPVVAAVRTPRDGQFTARLYGALVVVVTYLCAGLTDVMFGLELHTALYVCLVVIVIGYCRDARPQPGKALPS